MPTELPYRLQIFLDQQTRKALKDVAYHHGTSLQQLVEGWLLERLQQEGVPSQVASVPAARRAPQPVR